MLAPEKWHISKTVADTQDGARNRLSLTLCESPVFNAHSLSRNRVRISRDVPRRVDFRSTGAQGVVIHDDAVIDRQAGVLGQLCPRQYAYPQDDHLGLNCLSIAELNAIVANHLWGNA